MEVKTKKKKLKFATFLSCAGAAIKRRAIFAEGWTLLRRFLEGKGSAAVSFARY